MSDTTSSPAPGAAQPEPTSGTPAGASDIAPAASSAEPATEPVVEPVAETAETKSSLIAEAKPEQEPKAEEPKAEEPKAEEPKAEATPDEKPGEKDEPKAEDKPEEKPDEKAEDKPEVKPPVFEKYTLPEGVTVDEARIEAFNGLLGETETRIAADPSQAHAVMQELGQKLADFHVEEMKNAAERAARHAREHWDRTREGWVSDFRADAEIGKNRADTTLGMIGSLIDMYGTQAGAEKVTQLRDAFTMTGMGDNPEMLRFMHWAASRLVETRRIVVPQPSAKPPARTAAQTLYANTPVTRSA